MDAQVGLGTKTWVYFEYRADIGYNLTYLEKTKTKTKPLETMDINQHSL